MGLFYSFGILFYAAGIRLAALFNPKAKKWVEGRRNWQKNLPELPSRNIIWFHCASLGEFDQGLPVMNQLKKENPSVFILVTFFSPSGMEHYHKRKHSVDLALYLPIDTVSNAAYFIRHFQPKALFLVKYEFWSNFIFTAKKQNVLVFSISTLLRENQRFFKWYGGFFCETLKAIDHFFVTNETTGSLLEKINVSSYTQTGDTRFDRVLENKTEVKENQILEQFLQGQKAMIIGSSWSQDIDVLRAILDKYPERKFILAPHNVDSVSIQTVQDKIGSKACLYTSYSPEFNGNVLILNTIGHLASAYSYGDVAYVGGGFSGNLHNILEPCVFGLPVIFGPKFEKYPEAKLFIERGVGFSISTSAELESALNHIDTNHEELKQKAQRLIEEQRGSTDKILRFLKNNYPTIFES